MQFFEHFNVFFSADIVSNYENERSITILRVGFCGVSAIGILLTHMITAVTSPFSFRHSMTSAEAFLWRLFRGGTTYRSWSIVWPAIFLSHFSPYSCPYFLGLNQRPQRLHLDWPLSVISVICHHRLQRHIFARLLVLHPSVCDLPL